MFEITRNLVSTSDKRDVDAINGNAILAALPRLPDPSTYYWRFNSAAWEGQMVQLMLVSDGISIARKKRVAASDAEFQIAIDLLAKSHSEYQTGSAYPDEHNVDKNNTAIAYGNAALSDCRAAVDARNSAVTLDPAQVGRYANIPIDCAAQAPNAQHIVDLGKVWNAAMSGHLHGGGGYESGPSGRNQGSY
jgi:hypothetical protein